MTNVMKVVAVLLATSLFVACSSKDVDKTMKATATASVDQKVEQISGLVIAIENGKDGYTAQVDSKPGTVYSALVSIPNLGGPENYTRFKVGDRVTVKGKSMGSDINRFIVSEIVEVTSSRTQLLIGQNAFRGITTGDQISNHKEYIQKETMRTGEGSFEVYTIKDFNNNPAGFFLPDPNNETLVGAITVQTQGAKTLKGIQVGNTFGDLKKKFPYMSVHGSEVEGRTYANFNNLSYRLDVANFAYEVDMDKIPLSTKITEIIINRPAKTAAALEKEYSNHSEMEYCWLLNDAIELYAAPNRNSTKQGVHFKGELLDVLGTQIIDNKLWVNVAFKLEVKIGYEDRFADGRVTPSGSPTGWIDGYGQPMIRCK